ncbi:MAG: hypothetical protein ACOYBE_12635 [Blautia sp.]
MLTMTITERDKKLLRFMAVFLLLIGFVMLILLPMLDKLENLDAQAADMSTQKMEMEEKILSLPVYEAQSKELEEKFSKASENYYAMMSSQEIDRLLTGIALGYSLDVVEMDISMPTEPTKTAPYLYSGIAMEQQMQEEQAQGADPADASGQTGSEAAEAAAADTSGSAASSEQSASYIYEADVSMGVEGSKENIQAFIDSLNYDNTSMLVTRYQMDEAKDSEGGGRHLTISIAVYMYRS